MALAQPAGSNERLHRFCLAGAFVVTLLWGAAYIGYDNPGIIDEPGQLEAIRHFAEHRPGVPEALPNLPGYHFSVIWLTPGEPTLRSARLVTLGFALAGLAAFAAAWRRIHGAHPGGATLLLATLPIMQPFTAMAYTDVPAMAFLFAACWAQFSARHALAAGFLACACLIRQTCLIWAAYLLLVDLLAKFHPRGSAPPPRRAAVAAWIGDGRWLLLLIVTAAGIILYAGRLTVGRAHGNKLEPNLATIHFAALVVVLFGLPFWLSNAAAMVRKFRDCTRARPTFTWGLTAVALAVAALLAATYANPHVWNRELYWPQRPSTYVMLRNWPLVWIDRLPALRVISGLTVVGTIAGFAFLFARQRHGRELWLLLPFGAVLLLTNGLVEPRYLIAPCSLGLLWLEPGAGLVRQTGWFAFLCMLQSPFVMTGLALW
jgi:hypothetical protein